MTMKTARTMQAIGLTLGVLFLTGISAWAQAPTGGIAGTVYDRTGGAVPGAQMTLRSEATGATRTTTTSTAGAYEFPQLLPGAYALTAEAKGFRRMVQHNVMVDVGAVVHLDFTLEVGSMAETVEVTAEAPLIEPDKTSISKAVDIRGMQNFPMADRQFLNLALTVPGTTPGAPGTQVVAFSVAGMRTQSNNYTLDGISNNDPQVNGPLNAFRLADAVQEFNVQTSIASTEVGRNSGAQVNIITKSGANAYHGTLFYYHRNDAFDATPFFLNRAGQPKNPLRRHDYGGTVGGFLVRDKTFWFFSFEGFRQKVQEAATARVPTDAERAAVTDPVSLKVLQFWPRANSPFTGGRNWAGTTPNTDYNQTYFWRIDQTLSTNHRLMGRYAWFRGSTLAKQNTTAPFNGAITNLPGQHSFLVQETYASGRMVNELRLGYSRNRTFFQPADVSINPATIFTDASGNPLPGYINTSVDPLDGGLPRITITGLTRAGLGAGTNMPQGRATNTYEYIDNLTLIRPWGWTRHTLRFGFQGRREITNRFLNGNYRGSISFACFNAVDLRSTDPNASAPCTRNFAAGHPQRGTLRTGVGGTFRTWKRATAYVYAQDTFKARPNLMINYGLRWEYPGQMSEKHDRGSNFVPGVGEIVLNTGERIDVDPTQVGRAALILTPTNVVLPRTGEFTVPKKNFAPYLGIAYSPKFWPGLFGDGKTVIRTGFRLSYDDVFANIPVNMGLNFPPVLTTTLPTATYAWGTVLSQNRSLFTADPTIVPQGTRGIITFNAWDVNPPSSYGMNYALEIERQIGRDFAVEASYIGSQGRKLGVFVDPNQPFVTVNDTTKRGDQSPNVRVFPFRQYAGIGQAVFVSNSNYNGMILTVRKRPSHGLSFTADYEFGRSLDDNSSFFGSDGETGAYADTRNRKLDRGRSAFDVRHTVSGSAVYELPFGPHRAMLGNAHGLLGQIVGGWTIGATSIYRSGFPFTVQASSAGGTDFSGLNQFADRVNLAPGATVTTNMSDPDHAFNPSAFAFPGPGSAGNVGRNTITGPHSINVNIAVLKNFPFGEGRRVQFRAEFFNAFNHTNFKLPENRLDQGTTTGTIGDAFDPRLIQLGLRVEW